MRWILEERIVTWYDSGVNIGEQMPTNFIGPKLEKTGKLTRDKSVKEEKMNGWKVDIVEYAQASIASIKIRMKYLTHVFHL